MRRPARAGGIDPVHGPLRILRPGLPDGSRARAAIVRCVRQRDRDRSRSSSRDPHVHELRGGSVRVGPTAANLASCAPPLSDHRTAMSRVQRVAKPSRNPSAGGAVHPLRPRLLVRPRTPRAALSELRRSPEVPGRGDASSCVVRRMWTFRFVRRRSGGSDDPRRAWGRGNGARLVGSTVPAVLNTEPTRAMRLPLWFF